MQLNFIKLQELIKHKIIKFRYFKLRICNIKIGEVKLINKVKDSNQRIRIKIRVTESQQTSQ